MPKLEPESITLKINLAKIIDTGNIRELKKYGPNEKGEFPEEIRELAQSIKTIGQIQPIVIKQIGDQYELIAGFRRRAAFQYLCSCGDDYNLINATIATGEKLVIQLVENIQREDLTAPEREAAIFQLAESGLKQNEIAAQLSKTKAFVSIHISAWKMRQTAQNAGIDLTGVETSTLSELLSVPDAELLNVLRDLVRLGKTRAAAASLAAPFKKGKPAAPPAPAPEPPPDTGEEIDPLVDMGTEPESPAPEPTKPEPPPEGKKPETKPGKPAAPQYDPIEAEHRNIDLNIVLTVIYEYIQSLKKQIAENIGKQNKNGLTDRLEAAEFILALIHKRVDDA